MPADRALEILATGPLTLVQDLGRVGFAAIGVGASGAADRNAFRLGARLLAQPYTAAGLEVTFGGLSVRARGQLQLALTGAPGRSFSRMVRYSRWTSRQWDCVPTSRYAAG
jgi:allophanate hydrolase subunit 2